MGFRRLKAVKDTSMRRSEISMKRNAISSVWGTSL